MDSYKLNKIADFLDHIGHEFFAHFEKFKEAQKDAANMQLGGLCDTHLSEAIRCKFIFGEEIKTLKRTKFPLFGKSAEKSRLKQMIVHSENNFAQMGLALRTVEKTFIDGATTKLLLEQLKSQGAM